MQAIDRIDQEGLLVQGVGVAGVSVLVGRSFKIAHSRHIASIDSGPEARKIILVVSLVALADILDRSWWQVMRVSR